MCWKQAVLGPAVGRKKRLSLVQFSQVEMGHLTQQVSESIGRGARGDSGLHMRQLPRWALEARVSRTLHVESCGCCMCIFCRKCFPKQFKSMRDLGKVRRHWLNDI